MDRISELLIKILSFLPTKVAVSTSLLSKRWECLWMWLPKLNYDDSETEGQRLQSFLDIYLPLHRAPTIESLCLKLGHSPFKPQDIKLLVAIAVSRTITELKISYSSVRVLSGLSRLQSNLYACKSLEMLKLSGEILLDVPRLACLPSLKTLQLQNVRYFNEGSFHRLLSICPVLKHLYMTIWGSSRWVCAKYSFCEAFPNLMEAYVDVDFHDVNSLLGSIASVKSLTMCLIIQGAMNGSVFVFNQLEHLKLRVCTSDAMELLKDFPNLIRVLEIFEMDDHLAHRNDWNPPSTVPECMLSSLEAFTYSGYEGIRGERDPVVYILQNARHLKTATISFLKLDLPELEMIQELKLYPRASAMCKLTLH